jgi:hypothetical protein
MNMRTRDEKNGALKTHKEDKKSIMNKSIAKRN